MASNVRHRLIVYVFRARAGRSSLLLRVIHPINEMMVECVTAPQVRDNYLPGIDTKLKVDRSSKVPADELGPSV